MGKNLITLINDAGIKGSALQHRNAARLLGRKENWCKRLVREAFGEEACSQALSLNPAALEETKRALVALFEARFTDEDRDMEIALKKAAERAYSDDYEDEDDI